MKSATAAVLLAMVLAGCVAVPYEPAPAYGYYGPGAYYYGPPAATFHFGYHRYGHRHHRHRH
ncbi:MAG TPA: hypothetical protein VJ834_07400 [Burkholderiales bacterium]|jgi:hypothetical protein|nr:hypothetical protein [Burkholderiales bacterium]